MMLINKGGKPDIKGILRMARRRIWKNKPKHVRERLEAERRRAEKNNGGNGRRMIAIPPVETRPDVEADFSALGRWARTAVRGLMVNHGMSLAAAVNAVQG